MLSLLKHYLIPHHTNNFRPKALHTDVMVFYIIFFLFIQIFFSGFRSVLPDILGFATDINIERLLDATNQKRVSQRLEPLNLDPELNQAAVQKARDMFSKNYWAHNSPDGLTPWVFVKGAGYNYLYAGENLAKNFADSDGVVNAWMDSPSHRANLLKPEYRDIGFAVVNGRLNGEETTLVVQMFGAKQKMEVSGGSKELAVSTGITAPGPEISISPQLEVKALSINREKEMPAVLNSVKKQPFINVFSLTKVSSLGLVAFLITVLFIDTIFMWRRKTVRFSGHNFAHIFFFLFILGAILIARPGTIY